ncbi:MAG: DUF4262 domain-containing protein [Aureliella sp.]
MKKYTPESYAAEVKTNVEKHGFHLACVSASDQPSFCYSTGLFESFGLPELFISALTPTLASGLIHSYSKRFQKSPPPIGRRIRKGTEDPFDYYLIQVCISELRNYALASFRYYGNSEFSFLQLIYPDTRMQFPHEEGYNYDQIIVGEYSSVENE